jgi:hyperosmotically inducible protein
LLCLLCACTALITKAKQIHGVADVLAEKIFAEEIAKKVDGVRSIENDITISMDSSNITDSHIRNEIENKLYMSEKQEGLSNVGVDVKSGTAVLMGHVEDDLDKKKAVELASSARGVANIVDNIKMEDK